jgi:DUF4097 and DUF4098 domain-containing protein YvlB
VALLCFSAIPAWAQRVRFDRTFDVGVSPTLDVSTIRGSIEVAAGTDGRIVVSGEAVVRLGWNVPADAADVARAVADQPPVQHVDGGVRAHPPDDAHARDAVTVNYRVRVPRGTRVVAATESGATAVGGVAGADIVRTQSGAVTLTDLGSSARVTSGSAGVAATNVRGRLEVTTESGAIVGRDLGGALRARTSSGSVKASWAAPGGADVRTDSSSIDLRKLDGPVTAVSGSGRITVTGAARETWQVTTGSGGIELDLPRDSALTLDAASHSGSVTVRGADVRGTTDKRAARGTIGAGGSIVHVRSRSGSIRIDVGL